MRQIVQVRPDTGFCLTDKGRRALKQIRTEQLPKMQAEICWALPTPTVAFDIDRIHARVQHAGR